MVCLSGPAVCSTGPGPAASPGTWHAASPMPGTTGSAGGSALLVAEAARLQANAAAALAGLDLAGGTT